MAWPPTARPAMRRLRRGSWRKSWRCASVFRSTTEAPLEGGETCRPHGFGRLAGAGNMRCPYCGCENTQVKDSRPTEENQAIRRRRSCEDCGGRFTTFERVQLREIVVAKRSGRRVPFDREKLS